jgi:hypothetical protein
MRSRQLAPDCFILEPRGNSLENAASRAALLAYAEVIKLGQPDLADDLRCWARREEFMARESTGQLELRPDLLDVRV